MATETNIHRDSRLANLNALTEKGYNPYPYCFKPNAFAADLQEKYKDLPAGENTEDRVTVAGRAMANSASSSAICTWSSFGCLGNS